MYFDTSGKQKMDIGSFGLPPYAEQYLRYLMVELNLAPRTIFDYAVSLRTFLRWVKCSQKKSGRREPSQICAEDVSLQDLAVLERNDIYEFLAFCTTDRDNSASSRSAKLSALRSFYKYLTERDTSGVVTINPTLQIDTPKKEKQVPQYLNLDEVRLLLKTVKNSGSERDICMLLWLASCGMRLSELVSVNMKDVRKGTGEADLRLKGKGRKERIIPLSPQFVEVWEHYLTERAAYRNSATEEALFLSNRGTRISTRRVEQIVDHYIEEAGLQGKGYHVHSLRHSTATNLLKHTSANLMDVKNMLGHANVSSTERYLHLTEVQAKAVNEMGLLLDEITT